MPDFWFVSQIQRRFAATANADLDMLVNLHSLAIEIQKLDPAQFNAA